jgi:hypothetical protein
VPQSQVFKQELSPQVAGCSHTPKHGKAWSAKLDQCSKQINESGPG